MKRRIFLQTLSMTAGALAVSRDAGAIVGSRGAGNATPVLSPDALRDSSASLRNIGLELYAVRGAMKADPERTLAAIRRIGYTQVELLWSFDNFGRTPEQVRATLRAEGLTAPSCHMAPEMLLSDWEKHLATAQLLGQQYLIVPSLPAETNTSLDAWRKWADHFNEAGAAARKAGLWLAFHNEPDHMKPIDNNIPYDVFVARTDPSLVRLQLDVGNMTLGGGDPMQYMARFGERYHSFHLKDTTADRAHDTELGTGIFDFRKFLARVPGLDAKPCYVEQEGPKDEMASARKNYDFLRALTF
jgi:sugar phosphate isomerase/epimerase